MSTIVYGGVKYTQVRHAIKCKRCEETIESSSDRDYRICLCGAVAIDGGTSPGNRILGDPKDMEARSLYCAFVGNKRIWLPEAAAASAKAKAALITQ